MLKNKKHSEVKIFFIRQSLNWSFFSEALLQKFGDKNNVFPGEQEFAVNGINKINFVDKSPDYSLLNFPLPSMSTKKALLILADKIILSGEISCGMYTRPAQAILPSDN